MTSPETTTAPTERSLQALTLSVLEMAQASGNASSRVSRMAAREVKKVVTTAESK